MDLKYHPKATAFVSGLPDPKARRKIVDTLGYLEKYGIEQMKRAADAEKVEGINPVKMDELKFPYNKMQYRIFGGMVANFYGIFHGYIKRGKKLDRGEVSTALGRRREMIESL